jgi:hypothetical protein
MERHAVEIKLWDGVVGNDPINFRHVSTCDAVCFTPFYFFIPSNMRKGHREYPVLHEIYDMVEAGYVNGLPKHRLPEAKLPDFDPKSSSIYVATWEKFVKLTTTEVQAIFRNRHILVTDTPIEPMEFDEQGLETLAPLSQPCLFQGNFIFLSTSNTDPFPGSCGIAKGFDQGRFTKKRSRSHFIGGCERTC